MKKVFAKKPGFLSDKGSQVFNLSGYPDVLGAVSQI
jgi:hypothetical protein